MRVRVHVSTGNQQREMGDRFRFQYLKVIDVQSIFIMYQEIMWQYLNWFYTNNHSYSEMIYASLNVFRYVLNFAIV